MDHPLREDLTTEEWDAYCRAGRVEARVLAGWSVTYEDLGLSLDAPMPRILRIVNKFWRSSPIRHRADRKDLTDLDHLA